jgi:hypothetical protein
MEALATVPSGVWLALATATKHGPNGLAILQGVIILLGLVSGMACYFVLSKFVEPPIRRNLERKFGTTITVSPMSKFWNVSGGSPATHFIVGLVSATWTLVELAGAIVPLFLLFMVAKSLG